ncbi:hypothetical protein ACFL4G_08835 [Thermodesulfobacteriota bacterium]
MRTQKEPMSLVKNKKPYSSPTLTVYGSIEKVTGWIGAPYGEFFGGQGIRWNPWVSPGPQGS